MCGTNPTLLNVSFLNVFSTYTDLSFLLLFNCAGVWFGLGFFGGDTVFKFYIRTFIYIPEVWSMPLNLVPETNASLASLIQASSGNSNAGPLPTA